MLAGMAPHRPSVPTLGEMRQSAPWLWLNCAAGCGHHRAVALTPFIIRWGADVSGDMLRRAGRCTACGHKGATLQHPSWAGSHVGFMPFPVRLTPADDPQ